jgi:TonB family protein
MITLLLVRLATAIVQAQPLPDASAAPPSDAPDGGTAGVADGGTAGDPLWQQPKITHFESPTYPVEDQVKGLEGDVVLRLAVDTRGTVTEAQVLSSPDGALAAAATTAALKFQFSPAMNGAMPEASVVRYTLRFQLRGETAAVSPPAPASGGPAAPDADAGPLPGYRTQVTTQAVTSAASAQSVYDADLQERILRTPADLLHSVPDLFTAQHQGGGKADQYFLRGFDADHGTDINFSMDGVPINLPSNGHGQGYTDVHFVLPETIDRLDFSKGPYFADKGDFDTAGAVELHTRRAFDEDEIQVGGGQFDTYRVFGVGTTGNGPNAGWLAAEVAGFNGPYDSPENLQRYSVMAKQNLVLSPHTQLILEAVAYGSQWSASGLLPPRAIEQGDIDVWGSIDPNEGGQTQRDMLIATIRNTPSRSSPGDEGLELTAYFVRFQMRLFNDFTFFLTDQINGDLIEQNDNRFYGGLNARYHKTLHWGAASFTTTFGAGGRYDSMNVSLYHDDSERQHLPTCYGEPLFCDNVDIGQSNLFTYAEETARFTKWLRVVAGVRGDLFTWNVVDQRSAPLPDALPTTGLVETSIIDPKLALIFSPLSNLDIFLDGGRGFHSNDARSVIATNGVGAIPEAWGAEVGGRLNLFNHVALTSALWFLYLAEEVTFDPDIDADAPNPPTRRFGVDFDAKWDIYGHWLFADVDFMFAHVQYTTTLNTAGLSAEGVPSVLNGLDVPLAPTETCTAGLTAEFPFGLKTRLSLRQMDNHPANNDGTETVQGYALLDFTSSYRWRFLGFSLSVENMLNTAWREGQFDYVSRLPGEPTAGVEEVDYTPGAPINVQGSVTIFF